MDKMYAIFSDTTKRRIAKDKTFTSYEAARQHARKMIRAGKKCSSANTLSSWRGYTSNPATGVDGGMTIRSI